MLHSKTLWLTDLTKSNDAEEVFRAYCNLWNRVKLLLEQSDLPKDILKSQIEMCDSNFHIQSHSDVPYGCCLCVEDDLVQQWNEYGDSRKGVAVGFDLALINGLQKQYPITSALISHSLGYESVIYDIRGLELEMAKLCYTIIKNNGVVAWMTILSTFKHYASFIKNPTFKDEKETRIVFLPNAIPENGYEDSLDNLSDLKTNILNHYSLGWLHDGVSALKSITIGSECTATEAKIRTMLTNEGLNSDIPIKRSECTYRARQH
jgi:hypothetical protein